MIYERGIDVIVTNYRTPELIKGFVDSYLFQSSKVPTTITVVDVDPTEENYEEMTNILSEYRKEIDGLSYWQISDNCGYSGACNWASLTTNSEVIAFFNSDTKLFDTTLDDCYNYLMSDDGLAICGPLQTNSSGLVTHAGILGTNSQPVLRGWHSKQPSKFNDVRDDCVSVMGSAYFIKRHVWDELTADPEYRYLYPHVAGAFLPTQHYYEETWCSYFARHKGYKVGYLGTTSMIHEWHKSSQLGSVEGTIMNESRMMFRAACDHFGIEHD